MLALLATHKARFTQVAAPPGQDFARRSCCARPRPRSTKRWPRKACRCSRHVRRRLRRRTAAASKAVSKSAAPQRLPGHYYCKACARSVANWCCPEDGSFDYLMSYGAVDISASGAGAVTAAQVYLDTPPPPLQPFSALAGVRAGGEPARPENLTVRVYYQGRLVRADVAMSSASDDYAGAPRESEARTASARLLPPLASCARWPCSRCPLGRALAFRRRVEAGSGCAGPSASTWPCRKPRRPRRCIFQ